MQLNEQRIGHARSSIVLLRDENRTRAVVLLGSESIWLVTGTRGHIAWNKNRCEGAWKGFHGR